LPVGRMPLRTRFFVVAKVSLYDEFKVVGIKL
jgi:hypothetical protein